MKLRIPLAAALLCAALLPGSASALTTAGTPSLKDRVFMVKDYRGGLFELATANVVLADHSATVRARVLAKSLIKEHTVEVAQLRSIANAQKVGLSGTLSRHQKAELAKFRRLSGKTLSRSFARYEYDDHVKEALDYAIRYASTKDIAVKEYVRRWLPVYRKHQKLAAIAYRAVAGRNP